VASYRAINGVLLTLEHFFKTRMPAELKGGAINANVKILGSTDMDAALSGNVLGIYLHRYAIDPHGRSRFFAPQGTNKNSGPAAELPVNLHLLLIASGTSASIEANIMSWAMLALANESQFDISHLGEFDDGWSERENITIAPEDLTADELMRIWDLFGMPYTSSVPYIVRTVRLRLNEQITEGPAVISRVFPTGIAEA
jgi:hypothetical protein